MKSGIWGLVQKSDIKSQLWRKHSVAGVRLVALPRSQIFDLLELVYLIYINRSRPDFFVFRYLNDYQSLTRTICRSLSELAVVLFCRMFSIKIFWICHNVDKESVSFFPKITKLRRALLSKVSKKIFVTSELLIKDASQTLRNKHIDNISFGLIEKKENKVSYQNNFSSFNPDADLRILILGAPVAKSKHFDLITDLIERCRCLDISISVFIAGEFDKSERSNNLKLKYSDFPEIDLVETYVGLTKSCIMDNFNYYFRVYDDLSVPYTLYESCSYYIPTISLDGCFTARLISHYGIGYVLDKDMTNVEILLDDIVSVEKYHRFLKENNWRSLSSKIKESLSDD